MARNKGVASLGFNFQVEAAAPLDTRTVVQNLTDLTSESTWLKDGNLYIYEGMEVYVEETKNKYLLTDPANYNNIASWKVSGSGSGSSDDHVELTQAQYDALTTEEKNNGKVYFVNETTGSTTKGKIYKNGIMYNDLGTVTGNYTAGQGVRITNDVIDTPLLDNDYLKETVQVPGLVPSVTQQSFSVSGGSSNYNYVYGPSGNQLLYDEDWDRYFSREALTRDNAVLQIKVSGDSNWHMVTGYLYIGDPHAQAHPVCDIWPTRDQSDGNPYFYRGGSHQRPLICTYYKNSNNRITEIRRMVTTQVPGMVDTPVHVRQLSGVAKEDYSDEWFSDLTEQQIIDIFDNVYGEGAEINEQFEAGVSIPFGTWKENGVVYDLCRKVIYREGPFGNNLIIDPEITDCEFIVHVDGFVWRQDGYAYCLPSKDMKVGFTIDKKIQLDIEGDYSTYTKQRIIVEYARARG